jgi:hypothetical protein
MESDAPGQKLIARVELDGRLGSPVSKINATLYKLLP